MKKPYLEIHLHKSGEVHTQELHSLKRRTVDVYRTRLRRKFKLDRVKDKENYAMYLIVPSRANTT